jgi:peptidoglycan/xylan/chitin deacetylase (PgdA/CDA1 family)
MNLLAVNFHYFREETYPSGIYPVKKESFANQIRALSKYYTFISQYEIAQCINTNEYNKGNYCLITFDDGLKEQMEAFKWLKKNNIPAIFYVPVKPLVENTVLEVHKLHLVRAQVNDEELLSILKSTTEYSFTSEDVRAANEQYKYDNDIAREVKYQLNFKLSGEEKSVFIDTAFSKLYPNETEFAKEFYMNEEDVKQLADAGMLGSHGYAHIPLSQSVNAKSDIVSSISWLEQVTSKPVLSFSYPYGSIAAVDKNVTRHFIGTNVLFALTMWRGINKWNAKFNHLLLHRVDTNDAPNGKNNSVEYIP